MKNSQKHEPDNRHTANYLLVAHISYRTKSNEVVRKGSMIVGRCFSEREAKHFINEIRKSKVQKQIGFNANGPVYTEEYGPTAKLTSYIANGQSVTEHIDAFSIVEKSQYKTFQPN